YERCTASAGVPGGLVHVFENNLSRSGISIHFLARACQEKNLGCGKIKTRLEFDISRYFSVGPPTVGKGSHGLRCPLGNPGHRTHKNGLRGRPLPGDQEVRSEPEKSEQAGLCPACSPHREPSAEGEELVVRAGKVLQRWGRR